MKNKHQKINYYLIARMLEKENNDSNCKNSISGKRISKFHILHYRVFNKNMVGLCTGGFYGINKIKYRRKNF